MPLMTSYCKIKIVCLILLFTMEEMFVLLNFSHDILLFIVQHVQITQCIKKTRLQYNVKLIWWNEWRHLKYNEDIYYVILCIFNLSFFNNICIVLFLCSHNININTKFITQGYIDTPLGGGRCLEFLNDSLERICSETLII